MEKKNDSSKPPKEKKDSDDTIQSSHDSLRDFVANECKEQIQLQAQRDDGTDEGLDAERMNQFFQRALTESERMNKEVTKCHVQRQKLYNELGVEMFESWSQDHASEVLTKEQYRLWKNEEAQCKDMLKTVTLQNEDSGSDDASQ